MSPSDEKKLLTIVLQRLDSPTRSLLTAPWFLPLAWGAYAAFFIFAFQFSERLGTVALAIIFVTVGIFTGVIAFARICAQQEPIMRGHIDRESIVRRLAELEA